MVTQRKAPDLLFVLCGLGGSGDTICGFYGFNEPVEVLGPGRRLLRYLQSTPGGAGLGLGRTVIRYRFMVDLWRPMRFFLWSHFMD